jgi:CRISPR-associated protein (TIGR03984 family)
MTEQEFKPLKSKSKTIDFEAQDISAVIDALPLQGKTVVIYTLSGVRIEAAGDLKELGDDFLELRAFDQDGELHLIRDGTLKGRIRTDSDGGLVDVFDEEHLLWGSFEDTQPDKNGTYILTETRGTRIAIPQQCLAEAGEIQEGKRVTLTVRNYVTDKNAPFGFTDYRFVGFNVRDVEKNEDGE